MNGFRTFGEKKRPRRVRPEGTSDGSAGGAKDRLFLLDDNGEKPALLSMEGPMPTWLAGKMISELTASDAAYFAGYAL